MGWICVLANESIRSPCFIERTRFLPTDPKTPRRPFRRLVRQPRPGLLRREDRQRQRVPELDEGSKSV